MCVYVYALLVPPGSANVKDCLEEHRTEKGFGDECKSEINGMIERRVRDFRLDSRLRKSCEDDIYNMCAFFGDLDTMDSEDTSVVRCLQVSCLTANGVLLGCWLADADQKDKSAWLGSQVALVLPSLALLGLCGVTRYRCRVPVVDGAQHGTVLGQQFLHPCYKAQLVHTGCMALPAAGLCG